MNLKFAILFSLFFTSCNFKEKKLSNNLISVEVEKIIIDFEKIREGVGSKSINQLTHNEFTGLKNQSSKKLLTFSGNADEKDFVLKFAYGNELIFQGKKAILVYYNVEVKDSVVIFNRMLLMKDSAEKLKIIPENYWSVGLVKPGISIEELYKLQ